MTPAFVERRTRKEKDAERKKATSLTKPIDTPALLLRQIEERLQSRNMGERTEARSTLLSMVLKGNVDRAKELLCSNCRNAISSKAIEERRHARSVLSQLAYKKDSREAKDILEGDCRQTIEDFDLDALVFLGMNARKEVAEMVDAALEANFERIVKEMKLDTLAYMAAMSNCSIEIRRKAAAMVADYERRKGNLTYVHDATEDPEIKNMMAQALRRRER